MSAFREPPPIEELSELRWKRVERDLMQSLAAEATPATATASPQTSVWPKRAGVLTLVVSVAALAFFLLRGEEVPNTGTEPPVHAQGNHSEISTQDSSTRVNLAGVALDVEPRSRVSVLQTGEKLALTLHAGGVQLDVAPRDHEAPVSIVAGDVRIEVVGTVFSVYRSESDVEVRVVEGIVAVEQGKERVLVKSGQQWPSITPATQAALPPDSDAAATLQSRPRSIPSAKAAQPDARTLFEQAAQVEQAAPSKAIHLYKRAARGKGPWAANALFAQARLTISEGKSAAGKKLLRRYLERYPKGPNAADASELIEGL